MSLLKVVHHTQVGANISHLLSQLQAWKIADQPDLDIIGVKLHTVYTYRGCLSNYVTYISAKPYGLIFLFCLNCIKIQYVAYSSTSSNERDNNSRISFNVAKKLEDYI